jgi:hypothetical protein
MASETNTSIHNIIAEVTLKFVNRAQTFKEREFKYWKQHLKKLKN